MMYKLIMKREMNKQKLKFQLANNLMRNIKEVKISLLKKICMKFVKVKNK